MDSLMTSEFVTPAKIGPARNGQSSVGFIGISPKKDPNSLLTFLSSRITDSA